MLDFAAQGFIEVFRDGAMVSRHRQEREAIESILRHATGTQSGMYEIRYPVVRVTYTAPAPPPTEPPPPAPDPLVIDGGGGV